MDRQYPESRSRRGRESCSPSCALAARLVMERSPHVLGGGRGGKLCLFTGMARVSPDIFFHPGALRAIAGGARRAKWRSITAARRADETKKWHSRRWRDKFGNLAAATSTGGMTNKLPGRVGDSPLVGAALCQQRQRRRFPYRTERSYSRTLAAYDIAALMEYGGSALPTLCERVVMENYRRWAAVVD